MMLRCSPQPPCPSFPSPFPSHTHTSEPLLRWRMMIRCNSGGWRAPCCHSHSQTIRCSPTRGSTAVACTTRGSEAAKLTPQGDKSIHSREIACREHQNGSQIFPTLYRCSCRCEANQPAVASLTHCHTLGTTCLDSLCEWSADAGRKRMRHAFAVVSGFVIIAWHKTDTTPAATSVLYCCTIADHCTPFARLIA